MALNTTSVGMEKRIRFFLYMCSRNCIIIIVIINIIMYIVVVVMCQKRQMIVTSLGCSCYSGGSPQNLDCWSSCNIQRKTCGGMEGNSSIVIEDICARMACKI